MNLWKGIPEVQPIYTPQDIVESQKHRPHLEYPGRMTHSEASLCISGHMFSFCSRVSWSLAWHICYERLHFFSLRGFSNVSCWRYLQDVVFLQAWDRWTPEIRSEFHTGQALFHIWEHWGWEPSRMRLAHNSSSSPAYGVGLARTPTHRASWPNDIFWLLTSYLSLAYDVACLKKAWSAWASLISLL